MTVKAMVIAVLLKTVWRTEIPLRLAEGGNTPMPEETPLGLNPADLAALGLALAAGLPAGAAQSARRRVVALTVAPPERDYPLRVALGQGAHEAIRVWGRGWPALLAEGADGSAVTTRFFAQAAAAAIAPLGADLVVSGERSSDTGHECFGAFLAHALGMAFAHRVDELEREGELWRVVARLGRGYRQEMSLPAPLVATVAPTPAGLPEPPLPAWLAALRAPVSLFEFPSPPPALPHTVVRPPIPRVMAQPVPGAGLDAEGRIRKLVELPAAGGGRVVGAEVAPARQAAEIVDLLRARGYLG